MNHTARHHIAMLRNVVFEPLSGLVGTARYSLDEKQQTLANL